jgi:hypothetical protein
MTTQAVQQWCIGIDRTDGLNLVAKAKWVSRLGFGVQPVAAAMRLQIGLALRTARLNGLKSQEQCLV